MLIEKDPTLRNVSFLQLLEESKNSPIKIFMPVQRNYVWCDDFVARLCYEFHHVVTLFEKKAYLNDIIKSRITNYLTDGQQRTTSCLILVRILVYLFEKKKKEFMANLAGGGVNDIVFDELHDDWQRYKIDNITNQDEFFDRFYFFHSSLHYIGKIG